MTMKVSRRAFIQTALAAGAYPCFAGRRNFKSGDKVRLACVGIGQQAWGDIRSFANTKLVEIAALCDTDLEGKQCVAALKRYPNVPRFTDFRKMLDAMEGKIDALSLLRHGAALGGVLPRLHRPAPQPRVQVRPGCEADRRRRRGQRAPEGLEGYSAQGLGRVLQSIVNAIAATEFFW